MIKWKTKDGAWNPYIAGALVGVMAVAAVLATSKLTDTKKSHYLGTSTTFVRTAGFMEKVVAPTHVSTNDYFTKTKIKVDWQFMLVVGIFFGALASSIADHSFKLETVPPTWAERFGGSTRKRAIGGFLGGIVAMMGARLADGCPSGHGLGGMMQLTVSSLFALALFFSVGVVVAWLVYDRRRS
jgi:hypothetical protein